MNNIKSWLIVIIIVVVVVFVSIAGYFYYKKEKDAMYVNDPENTQFEQHSQYTGVGTLLTGVTAIDNIIVNAPTFTKRNQCKKYGRRACRAKYRKGKDYRKCKKSVHAALCTM